MIESKQQDTLIEYTDGIAPSVLDDFKRRQRPEFSELPDIQGFDWIKHDRIDSPQLTGCGLYPRRRKDDCENISDSAYGVTGGIEEYLQKHAVGAIPFPETFSTLDNYTKRVSTWTARGSGYAIGIPKYHIRHALRLANGKGRYSIDDVHIVLCENDTIAICGPRGVFIDKCVPVKSGIGEVPSPPDHVFTTIRGIQIPEEDPELREGFKRFVDIVDEFTEDQITGYDYFDGKHWLNTSSGRSLYVRAITLSRLATMAPSVDEMYGVYSHTFRGDTFNVEWGPETTEYTYGDEFDSVRPNQIVVGFGWEWNRQEYIWSGGVYKVQANKKYLMFDPQDNDRYDRWDIDFDTKTEPLEEFDVDE